MSGIKVLDVTLRDGGCVNDFNFGTIYMDKIIDAQEKAGIDVIELGYLDEKDGSEAGRTKYINEKIIPSCILKNKKKNITYVAMVDYGKFNVANLEDRTNEGIDGIRIAFHKKNLKDIVHVGKQIMQKGYKLYVQPMVTLRYSDKELLELIELVNNELSGADAFYIVDSFGEMRTNDMIRIINLIDYNLNSSIALGLHSHNNLQLSYSNAMTLLQFSTNRDILLDSSIMGMGKGAGNLNTELLLEHLNLYYGKCYNIAPLLEVIDKVINQIYSEFYWGYAPEYYLSSVNHCTPSYASYFYNKHMLPIDQVKELLSLIDEGKKISFDRKYAEELYRQFNESKFIDDKDVVNKFYKEFKGKTILLVAPGKSVTNAIEMIKGYEQQDGIILIGVNTPIDIQFNYILTTRKDIYEREVVLGKNVIVTSNISKGGRGNVNVLNYANWIEVDEKTHDSSFVIVMNLLRICEVKTVLLAGFDGFSPNINDNYYDPYLRHPIDEKQADEDNAYYIEFIKGLRNQGMDIKFITPSIYEK